MLRAIKRGDRVVTTSGMYGTVTNLSDTTVTLRVTDQVKLEFENVNSPELGVYGVDHVKVAEGLGCKAIRVTDPSELGAAFEQAKKLAAVHRVPVIVEAILERVTNIAMSTTNDISDVAEFEPLATEPGHAPTAVRPLEV